MKLHILVAQRKCRYAGQYAPEALEMADEITMDENPTWFNDKIDKYKGTDEFDSLKTLVLSIPDSEIDDILYPEEKITQCEILSR